MLDDGILWYITLLSIESKLNGPEPYIYDFVIQISIEFRLWKDIYYYDFVEISTVYLNY